MKRFIIVVVVAIIYKYCDYLIFDRIGGGRISVLVLIFFLEATQQLK